MSASRASCAGTFSQMTPAALTSAPTGPSSLAIAAKAAVTAASSPTSQASASARLLAASTSATVSCRRADVDVDQRNVGAGMGERRGDGLSDPLGGAGDGRDAAVQREVDPEVSHPRSCSLRR